MNLSTLAQFDVLRMLSYSSISTSYTIVGKPITHSVRILKFLNTTDVDIAVSIDAIDIYDYIPAGSYALYDIAANSLNSNQFFLSASTSIYAASLTTNPTSGVFAITCIYAKGQ